MVCLSGDRSLFGPRRPPRSHQFCLHGAAPVRPDGPAYAPLAGWGQYRSARLVLHLSISPVSPFRSGIASARWWRCAGPRRG